MPEPRFTNREIDLRFGEIKHILNEHTEMHLQILEQVKYTNGKVRRITMYLTIVGTATATIFATNGAELISFLKIFL